MGMAMNRACGPRFRELLARSLLSLPLLARGPEGHGRQEQHDGSSDPVAGLRKPGFPAPGNPVEKLAQQSGPSKQGGMNGPS